MKELWKRLSKREKSLVLLACAIFVLVLGRYFLVSPFLERRANVQREIEMESVLLRKNLRYLDRKAELKSALEASRADFKRLRNLLLSGNTPSISASNLQQLVEGLASKEKTAVISTRVSTPEVMGPFMRVSVRVDVRGEIAQIANLIQGIETSDKLLTVDELDIRSLYRRAKRSPRGRSLQDPPRTLRSSLLVSGFIRKEAPEPD